MLPGKIGTLTLVCLVNVVSESILTFRVLLIPYSIQVPSSAIISDIESLLAGSGQRCSVGASQGLCTYSMLCTFAKVGLMLTSLVILLTYIFLSGNTSRNVPGQIYIRELLSDAKE